MRNRDKWSSLSMRDRADLIKLYVSNGITSLNSIKKNYNSFDEGGNTEDTEVPSEGYLRDLAYRISVNPEVSTRGYAPIKTIIKELNNSNENVNIIDDNKLTFLYGNVNGLYPAEESNGKDYSTYLKRTYPIKYKRGKIKEYQGTINPFNEYVFDERDKLLVEELAKKGKGLYSNADTEYAYMADSYDNNTPYRDDVASYHMQFVNTPNGYAISASDLYDFGPDYKANKYSDVNAAQLIMSNLQGRLLGAVGNPFILRQDNIPIRFIDTVNGSTEHRYGEDATRAKDLRDAIDRAMLSDKEREAGMLPEEKIAQILETGYIQPSLIVSKADGGKLNKYTTGGPLGEGEETYNNSMYNHTEEQAIYFYLRSRGVPHTQASAIMGNIAVESYLNPNISQIGGGRGYGLIQATDKARKDSFINYDGQPYEFGSKLDPETQRQLDYIIDKGLNTYTIGEWKKVKGTSGARDARKKFLSETDIDKASDLFTRSYLRPGKPHRERRQSMSNYFNDKYAKVERALEEFNKNFSIN